MHDRVSPFEADHRRWLKSSRRVGARLYAMAGRTKAQGIEGKKRREETKVSSPSPKRAAGGIDAEKGGR